jgi:hypothetical protein
MIKVKFYNNITIFLLFLLKNPPEIGSPEQVVVNIISNKPEKYYIPLPLQDYHIYNIIEGKSGFFQLSG